MGILRKKLRYVGLGSINVGLVEDFQGQESRIVLITTVLTKDHPRWNNNNTPTRGEIKSASKNKLGFTHDPRQFNVAITRAQALCIVIGHVPFLEDCKSYWTVLIEH